eukprot:6772884-Pyramimonas_sp.AAC.1
MYDFDDVTIDGHGWGTHDHRSYDEECTRCEQKVTITTEMERMDIIRATSYSKSKKGLSGIIVIDAGAFGGIIQKGDRLEPSPEFRDIACLRTAPLPMHLTFWRRHTVGGAMADPVLRRNPLLDSNLLGNARGILRIDTLRTLYLGVMQVFVQAVLFRVVQVNPWRVDCTTKPELLDIGFKNLEAQLFDWYAAHKIDQSYRLKTLTPQMFGGSADGDIHAKAAETLPL